MDLSDNMMLAHEQFFLENKPIAVREKDGKTFATGSDTEKISNEFHRGRRAIIDSCKALLEQENLIAP
ncbi:MAG: hypothetical protein R8G66_34665 [Cytophagales bacterium]|nr:hypothetical protein [Cytophagales bacterium]